MDFRSAKSPHTGIVLLLHALFIPLFALSVIYFHERLYGDPAWNLVRLINDGHLKIIHGRSIILTNQFLPRIGMILGLNLKALMMLFSVGLVLYFYGIFLIILHRYKDVPGALMIIALQTVGILHLYFVLGYQETYFATGLAVLFYSYRMHGYDYSRWSKWILGLLTVLLMDAHPNVIFLFAFLIAFEAISTGTKFLWLLIPAFAVWGLEMLTMDPYEASVLDWWLEGLRAVIGDQRRLVWGFGFYPKFNPGIVYCWAVVMLYYLWKRQVLKLLLVNVFCAGIFLIVVSSSGYPDFSARDARAQYIYVLINVFVLIPFFYDFFRNVSRNLKWASGTVLAGLMLFKMWAIYDTGKIYTTWIEQMDRMTAHADRMGGSRFLIDEYNVRTYRPETDGFWSLMAESLLMSGQHGPDHAVLFYEREHYMMLIENDDLAQYSNESINQKYFRVSGTDMDSLNRNGSNSAETLAGVFQIQPQTDYISGIRPGQAFDIDLSLSNTGGQPVFSGKSNELTLGYSIRERASGSQAADSIYFTPFEVDIYDHYEQPMRVIAPHVAGTYEVVPALMKAGETVIEASPVQLTVE